MVSGKQSRYVEGFKNITIDDDVLLDNIKNAINMSIEGNNSGVGAGSQTMNKNPTITKKMTVPTPTSGKSSEPMPTSTLGLTNSNEMSEANPEPTYESESTTEEETNIKSPFANINNRIEKTKKNNNKSKIMSGKVIGGMDEEEPVNRFQEDDENDMENEKQEITKKKAMRNAELKEKNNEDEDGKDENDKDEIEEGFSGSKILEANSMKNLLLAVLIAFIGYVIAMASMKNFLPITEISPDLKRFKNLIYVGLFFIIVYLCLEVF